MVVRADEAEYLPSIGHILLADSSATHGALSSHRVQLGRGADGAVPHQHRGAAELFFVLDGALDVLAGEEVLSVGPATCWSCRRAWPTRSPRARTRRPTR